MGEVGGRGFCDAVDLMADLAKTVLDAGDDALNLARAFAGVLRPHRGFAALADQAADLAVEPAHGVADLLRRLPGGFREILHLARDHRKAAAGIAGARGLDGGVEREQVGLLGDRLDRGRDFCDLRQRRGDRAEPALDAADRLDQLGDVPDRGFHGGARLRDLVDRGGGRRLHGLRGAGDVVVGRNHGLGGLLQVAEPVRLRRDALRHFLHIAGDVGELDAEAADAVGELVDEALALRRRCGEFRFG